MPLYEKYDHCESLINVRIQMIGIHILVAFNIKILGGSTGGTPATAAAAPAAAGSTAAAGSFRESPSAATPADSCHHLALCAARTSISQQRG